MNTITYSVADNLFFQYRNTSQETKNQRKSIHLRLVKLQTLLEAIQSNYCATLSKPDGGESCERTLGSEKKSVCEHGVSKTS